MTSPSVTPPAMGGVRMCAGGTPLGHGCLDPPNLSPPPPPSPWTPGAPTHRGAPGRGRGCGGGVSWRVAGVSNNTKPPPTTRNSLRGWEGRATVRGMSGEGVGANNRIPLATPPPPSHSRSGRTKWRVHRLTRFSLPFPLGARRGEKVPDLCGQSQGSQTAAGTGPGHGRLRSHQVQRHVRYMRDGHGGE